MIGRPAYNSGPHVAVERDWLDDDNAHELARRIAAYWQKRGKPGDPPVLVHVERQTVSEKHIWALPVVRSNLIGGLPPRKST